MPYLQCLYHIIIRTKYNKRTLPLNSSEQLYKYISGIVKNNKSVLYQINGIEDHIHMLVDIHPAIALSDFVKDIKVASSIWLKANPDFPDFIHGQWICSLNIRKERETNDHKLYKEPKNAS